MAYFQTYNKYNAVKTEVDGVHYDSKFEAGYAGELKIRKMAGEITHWEHHVQLDLRIYDKHWAYYKIDFIVHFPDGHREFVETKGVSTSDFRQKWRAFEIMFDKDFKEHPDDCMILVKQKSTWRNYKKRV